jgi:hypothetical protein
LSEGSRSILKVTFVNEKREIEVPAGSNLREEAAKAAVSVYSGMSEYLNRLGHGQCGTCRATFAFTTLSPAAGAGKLAAGGIVNGRR